MRTKESWFPKFKPHTGNLETPVQIDEYLLPVKVLFWGYNMLLLCSEQLF